MPGLTVVLDDGFRLAAILATAAFSTLRIWAIWGHDLAPTLAVFLTSAVVPALNLAVYAVGYVARSAAIANDLLVLALTWVKTAGVWRESLKMKEFRPTLTTLLLRDGSLYFVILLATNIVVLVLDTLQSKLSTGSEFGVVNNAITANLITRFILDLRSVSASDSVNLATMSSIAFGCPSTADHVDAPIDIGQSTWTSGPFTDVAGDEGEQYEEE
ncbi:hypothetical protein EIP91_009235 [Steccherinum ochraceum]|uniref:Uncharacterized protein n=1 Tax=Steccherinum ochraceum TaxID=92696 RepID=A0A4R0R1W4_9APHY|nr:hypothetical protein EIP91_009235 [Steccherinum ochraceum]